MQKKAAAVFVISVMLLASIPTHAAVIFDNFGPGDTYNDTAGYTVGSPSMTTNHQVAVGFTPTGNFTLDTIVLGMILVGGANELDIMLASNAGGEPGSVLETIQLSNAVPSFPAPKPPVLATSALHPLLSAGTQYWVIASAPTSGSWMSWQFNSTGDTGPTANRIDMLPWSVFAGDARNALRITGTAVAAIPEPSTYALMLAGVGIVGWAARRRRIKTAVA